jgi:hypothetical protein
MKWSNNNRKRINNEPEWSNYNCKRINNESESTHNRWRIQGRVQTFRIIALETGAAFALTEDSVSYGNLDKNQSADQKLKEEIEGS